MRVILPAALIDVAQDLIIFEKDCGTEEGIWLSEKDGRRIVSASQ